MDRFYLLVYVFHAIIRGFISLFSKFEFSSHKTGDYNSCSTENDVATCLICDGTKKRVFTSSRCKCNGGWFDDGSNE